MVTFYMVFTFSFLVELRKQNSCFWTLSLGELKAMASCFSLLFVLDRCAINERLKPTLKQRLVPRAHGEVMVTTHSPDKAGSFNDHQG